MLGNQLDDRHRNPNINIREIIMLGNQLAYDVLPEQDCDCICPLLRLQLMLVGGAQWGCDDFQGIYFFCLDYQGISIVLSVLVNCPTR